MDPMETAIQAREQVNNLMERFVKPVNLFPLSFQGVNIECYINNSVIFVGCGMVQKSASIFLQISFPML